MKVLFKDQEVQKLLDDYQRLVGVRIAVFDTSFNELYSSPRTLSSFCQTVRSNEHINEACKYCDQKAFRQAKANKDTYIYKCHLGLYEAVTPIYDQHQILGYVMIGQVLGELNKEVQWQQLEKHVAQISSNLDLSKIHYYNLKQMSIDEIEAVSRIMKACASSIWLQHIIDIERSPITSRINSYINDHYYEPITTASICADLNISKTTIYNYLKDEYNQSLSQYITSVRLEQAKDLLIKSSAPISVIAHDVGFDDYNYFSRKFKQAFSKTPTTYRKEFLINE